MTKNRCPQCLKDNREGAKFCANCGASLTDRLPADKYKEGNSSLYSQDSEAILQGRYRLEGELGRGGFGAVYRAWDMNLNRSCAVKENLEISPEAQRQFTREATVLANLSHPNLPRVTDHFIVQGRGQYLVMDFVAGEDLVSLMERKGAISVEQAQEWMIQVADALIYLHSRVPAVIHRDIKPANIRITPDNRAMLVDFGLVKVYDPHSRTTVGARAVTPGYAPPEQYGQGRTDARTDIYALGATLYKMLTNLDPLESVQRMSGIHMLPAHEVNGQVPPPVGQVVACAMELDPDARYQTARELKSALEDTLAIRQDQPVRSNFQGSTVVVEPDAYPHVRPAMHPPPARAIPSRGKRSSGKALMGLSVVGFIAICVLVSFAVGFWYVNMQQEQKQKEQTVIALDATQTSEVIGTSTQEAHKTDQAKASLTALAGWTATIQSRERTTAEALATRTAGVQLTASSIIQRTEAALGAITATAQAPATWYIEVLDAKVTDLKFFHKDASDNNIYGTRFDKDAVDYIYYEIHLTHNTKGYRTFTLTIIYYYPDRTIRQFTSDHQREADWSTSRHWEGWGWEERGNFPTGTYQVDIFMDEVKVATGTFEIYD